MPEGVGRARSGVLLRGGDANQSVKERNRGSMPKDKLVRVAVAVPIRSTRGEIRAVGLPRGR